MLTERIRHHEPETSPPIARTIVSDFVQTFKFSQGRFNHQIPLYEYVALSLPPDQLLATYPKFAVFRKDVGRMVFNIHTPASHVSVEDKFRRRMIKREWKIFRNIVKDHHYSHVRPELDMNSLVHIITSNIAVADTEYQDEPRPGAVDRDPHESFLRTYGLERKPTRSATFDNLFAMIYEKELLPYKIGATNPTHASFDQTRTQPTINNILGKLVHAWRQNHSEPFFPVRQSV